MEMSKIIIQITFLLFIFFFFSPMASNWCLIPHLNFGIGETQLVPPVSRKKLEKVLVQKLKQTLRKFYSLALPEGGKLSIQIKCEPQLPLRWNSKSNLFLLFDQALKISEKSTTFSWLFSPFLVIGLRYFSGRAQTLLNGPISAALHGPQPCAVLVETGAATAPWPLGSLLGHLGGLPTCGQGLVPCPISLLGYRQHKP